MKFLRNSIEWNCIETPEILIEYTLLKPKFKLLASQNESIPFLIVDAEKFPESRKLAKVDNLPTFATFKNGVLVNQTQTNKAEVLTELVNEVL